MEELKNENKVNDNSNIILYSIGCPRCKMLETMLDKKDIKYTICEDQKTMEEKGIMSIPVLETQDGLKDYYNAIKWIKNL